MAIRRCFCEQRETAVQDTLPFCARENWVQDVESKTEDLRILFEGDVTEHGFVNFLCACGSSSKGDDHSFANFHSLNLSYWLCLEVAQGGFTI